jgi:hypothetical protein
MVRDSVDWIIITFVGVVWMILLVAVAVYVELMLRR